VVEGKGAIKSAMGAKEETQELNSLSVQAVGELLGLKLPAKGMARCPFPSHEDSKPSFEVRSAGRRWICYSCNRRGGAIDLVMAVRNLTFIEAKRWLAIEIGMVSDGQRSRPMKRFTRAKPVVPPNSTDGSETPPDDVVYAALLAQAPLAASGRSYLQGRGLDSTMIARFRIGQMPGPTPIRELVRSYGFARVDAAGLLTKKSTPGRFRPIFPEGSLLFPYFEGKSIVYLQARLISENDRGGRWRNLNHRRRRIYNSDVIKRVDLQRIGICEGAIDVISATQLGHEAIGLIGVSAGLSNDQLIALRGKQVDLLLDWDVAGDERAQTMLEQLRRYGIAATRKLRPSPKSKDINDYLRQVSGPS
jgi:DNA primase